MLLTSMEDDSSSDEGSDSRISSSLQATIVKHKPSRSESTDLQLNLGMHHTGY